uniref:Uncharacterized protein n=1 Tax=Oryza brachyantha TaxID=4533 RepID=J3MTW6_ORYBR
MPSSSSGSHLWSWSQEANGVKAEQRRRRGRDDMRGNDGKGRVSREARSRRTATEEWRGHRSDELAGYQDGGTGRLTGWGKEGECCLDHSRKKTGEARGPTGRTQQNASMAAGGDGVLGVTKQKRKTEREREQRPGSSDFFASRLGVKQKLNILCLGLKNS